MASDKDAWIGDRALREENLFSRTYVVCVDDKVVAHLCIAAGSIDRHDAPGHGEQHAVAHTHTKPSLPLESPYRLTVQPSSGFGGSK